MTAAQRKRALAGGTLGIELNHWIERVFVLPEPDLPNLRHCAPTPEVGAGVLRAHWKLGDHPIQNMIHLLEAKGVRVFSLAENCKEVDAFSFWRGPTPFVFLNTAKSAERSRFDAAHELGHLVLHSHRTHQGRDAESEADQFASAFLMPRASILAETWSTTIPDLVSVKHFWGVSVAALVYRLKTLEVVSEWRYRNLAIEIQRLGYRVSEPEGIPREMSHVWPSVFRELRRDGIRRTDIARKLGWPLEQLSSLMFQLVLGVVVGSGTHQSPKLPPGRESPLRVD